MVIQLSTKSSCSPLFLAGKFELLPANDDARVFEIARPMVFARVSNYVFPVMLGTALVSGELIVR